MTFTYCDARYDGTPVHRCLCHHQSAHTGAHQCVCTHEWGIDWNHLTYDQQRELCGLPKVPKPWEVNVPLVGQRIAYTDQYGHIRDAGIVTEIQSVNDVVTFTTQRQPPEYYLPQRWLVGIQDIEERP